MRAYAKFFVFVFELIFFATPSFAQILEDDFSSPASSSDSAEVEDNEALFDELFSDYSEAEKDISKIQTFNDAMEQAADLIQKNISLSDSLVKQKEETKKEIEPIDGEILLGLVRGSFGIQADSQNRPVCSFAVALKSTLNRNIKTIGLTLRFPKGNFAFVFRNISANGSQRHVIRTRGEVCHNLSGYPDINIHNCKIYNASSRECVQRTRWVEKMDDNDIKKSILNW